jgi:hypothetical protein
VKAADLLLRDGNFPLVIVDLVLNAPGGIAKNSANELVSLATVGRGAAHGMSGSHAI